MTQVTKPQPRYGWHGQTILSPEIDAVDASPWIPTDIDIDWLSIHGDLYGGKETGAAKFMQWYGDRQPTPAQHGMTRAEARKLFGLS